MLCLGFAGAVLDVSHHVVGLDQEGAVGYFGFFLGGLGEGVGNGRAVIIWCSGSVGGDWGSRIY